jgi:WD40 repeat protein
MRKPLTTVLLLLIVLTLPQTALHAQSDDPSFTVNVLDLGDTLTHDITVSPDGSSAAIYSGQTALVLKGIPIIEYDVDPSLLPIRLIDLTTGEELRALTGMSDYVADVAFTSDGQTIASLHRNGTVSVWDVETGVRLNEFRTVTGAQRMRFLSDDITLVLLTGDPLSQYFVVDTETGHIIDIWRRPIGSFGELQLSDGLARLDNIYIAFDISPDDSLLVTATANGEVALWNTKTLQQAVLQPKNADQPGRFNVRNLRFSANGERVVYYDNDTEAMYIWNVDTLSEEAVLPIGSAAFALSPVDNTLAWADENGLWWVNLDEPESVTQLSSAPLPVLQALPVMSFSADGSRLVVGAPRSRPDDDEASLMYVVDFDG